jgi:hypothetical protein
LLRISKESPIVPVNWLDENNIEILKNFIEKYVNLKDDYTKSINSIYSSIKTFKELNGSCPFEIDRISNSIECENILKNVENIISSNPCFYALKNDVSNFGFIAQNESLIKESTCLYLFIASKKYSFG